MSRFSVRVVACVLSFVGLVTVLSAQQPPGASAPIIGFRWAEYPGTQGKVFHPVHLTLPQSIVASAEIEPGPSWKITKVYLRVTQVPGFPPPPEPPPGPEDFEGDVGVQGVNGVICTCTPVVGSGPVTVVFDKNKTWKCQFLVDAEYAGPPKSSVKKVAASLEAGATKMP